MEDRGKLHGVNPSCDHFKAFGKNILPVDTVVNMIDSTVATKGKDLEPLASEGYTRDGMMSACLGAW